MHQSCRADHLATKGLADGLMSEADAEQRHASGEVANELDTDARFLRRTRPGRDYDAVGMYRFDLVDGDLVVAADHDLFAQFAKVLDEVVSEGVVVVEYENHKFSFEFQVSSFEFQVNPTALGLPQFQFQVSSFK